MLWHPVDSQRLTMWASRFGKQEQFFDELSKLHFEQGRSNGLRQTLLEAVRLVGLSVPEAAAYLDTDQDVNTVWDSYRLMVRHYQIKEIPVFSFAMPDGISPFDPRFRPGTLADPLIVIGSGSVEIFLEIFNRIVSAAEAIDRAKNDEGRPKL